MNLKASEIVNLLGLKELPEEGGYFAKTYQSPLEILINEEKRSIGDAIYYLITEEQFSGLHKLKCEEMWHFYAGDPIEMVIYSENEIHIQELGNTDFKVHKPQVMIKANHWQGAKLKKGGKWALLGTNAFPGYEHSDFMLGKVEMFQDLNSVNFEILKKYIK